MNNEFDEFSYDESRRDQSMGREYLLAETTLSVLMLGRDLNRDTTLLPITKQFQLAIQARHFSVARHDENPHLQFPDELYGVIDGKDINFCILTYNFGSQADRPFMELRLETEDLVVITITNPGLDAKMPYKASVIFRNRDYEIELSTGDVAAILRQIVLPEAEDPAHPLSRREISDPLYPPDSHNIIETLIESQHADSIESQSHNFVLPADEILPESRVKINMHTINGESQEIEIELVQEDDIVFDDMTNEPIQHYRAIVGTFVFDNDDFNQSVQFTALESGKDPENLPNDPELLKLFLKEVTRLSDILDDRPEIVGNIDDEEI
ncbi:MAG: hypothetical protein ACSLEY_02410 [Candidatus Saccharimonadales bacterium]